MVSFSALTLCVASQRVIIVVISLPTQSGNFWIYPRMQRGVGLRIRHDDCACTKGIRKFGLETLVHLEGCGFCLHRDHVHRLYSA
jgi:hypothetical protein